MKFKLDENIGTRTQKLFQAGGYKVSTVREEGLEGKSDSEIYARCCREKLCLVSLDKDFLDVFRFPPNNAGGIVVIRLPANPNLSLLEYLIKEFISALGQAPLDGRLWVVEPGRIRLHQAEDDESE